MNLSSFSRTALATLVLLGLSAAAFAQEGASNALSSQILDDQRYNKAIHIMVMLLIGFGFLMVFVRKYGRSALTATFLLVSTALPLYMIGKYSGCVGLCESETERLILAEFGAASLLIAAGALLGRFKMHQYILLGLFFIPFYMLNEWVVLLGGFGLIPTGSVIDTGGSIVIHAFGAIFGVFAAVSLTTKQELQKPIEADATSDRYSMLGSMALWVFWPSFCAALVPQPQVPNTVVNVIIALCGSTIATYLMTLAIRKKISLADIANAALAGGVAIGSTCAIANHTQAGIIGVMAGIISTVGFALIQSRQQKLMKIIDTCGVSNLHGFPGLLGGLAVLVVTQGMNIGNHLTGMGITVVVAILGGLITGKIISLFGRRKNAYEDAEEFLGAEE
jgi:ammonium transporter Rh